MDSSVSADHPSEVIISSNSPCMVPITHAMTASKPAVEDEEDSFSKVSVLLEMSDDIRVSDMFKLGSSSDSSKEPPEVGVTDGLKLTPKLDLAIADGSESSSATMPFIDSINLDDFVDIVTTYKCKFCSFSCAWKSGLMSHIRNAHIGRALVSSDSNSNSLTATTYASSIPTFSIPESGDSSIALPFEDSNSICLLQPQPTNILGLSSDIAGSKSEVLQEESPQQVKQMFLCGNCHQEFTSFELCKEHIISDHQQILETETVPPAKMKKKAKPRRTSQFYTLEPVPDVENGKASIEEPQGKRQIRPPKALSEDYLLYSRPKRYVQRPPTNPEIYTCEYKGCNQHFSSESNLNLHLSCHGLSDRKFRCTKCSFQVESWRKMTMHLWKEHQIDMDLLACPDCSYRTYSTFKMGSHRRIHSDERAYTCKACGKSFKQMSQLRNHSLVHVDRKKGVAEKRWFNEQKCDICFRTFSDTKCLRKHVQAIHSKIKPYICSYCPHASSRKAMLELHMRQHTGEKPFKCYLCDYRTVDHNSLRRHNMRHTGAKKYQCPHCDYACIQASSFKCHMRSKHPGKEGLYCCDLCEFRSVNKDNYENHMTDHLRGAIPTKTAATVFTDQPTTEQPTADTQPDEGSYATAQMIQNCLTALSQDGGECTLPPGVTASSNQDGTITIQIPNLPGSSDSDCVYLTIQQPQEFVDSGPSDLIPSDCVLTAPNDDKLVLDNVMTFPSVEEHTMTVNA